MANDADAVDAEVACQVELQVNNCIRAFGTHIDLIMIDHVQKSVTLFAADANLAAPAGLPMRIAEYALTWGG